MTEPLWKRLEIQKGVTAIIGSGGKTTLLYRLCEELPGTVIVCTSTHIFPPDHLPVCTEPVEKLPAEKCCLGTFAAENKLGAPVQSFEALQALADYVLVEADGSKRLPLKAHLSHEPVIPACSNQVIQVLGLSGLGNPVKKAAHRAEQYAQLCHSSVDAMVTPELAAQVLNTEALADQYVLNQADLPGKAEEGRKLAALLNRPALVVSLKPPLGDQGEVPRSGGGDEN